MSDELPPGVRFLAGASDDQAEQQSIVRAYYSLAHGTPESAAVQFSLLATALAKRQAQTAESIQVLGELCEALLPVQNKNTEVSLQLLQSRQALDPRALQAAVRNGTAATLEPFARVMDTWTARLLRLERKFLWLGLLQAGNLLLAIFLLILRFK